MGYRLVLLLRSGVHFTAQCAIAGALFTLCSFSSIAAEKSAEYTNSRLAELEEIVVTAQKREESLQKIPIAVSAFSTTDLESIGATDFTAIGNYGPNLNIMPQSGANGTTISIRGIGSADPSTAVDPKVGLYVDGVYVARNTATVFELDMDRIEVLRGPQGTLWGKNTTGGSINVITAKPTGEFGVQQDFGVGNFGRFRSRTVLDLPPLELGDLGQVNLRLSYLKTMTDGWATRTNRSVSGPRDLGERDSDSFRLAFSWQAAENFAVDYALDYITRDGSIHQDQLLSAPASFGADQYASRRKRLSRFALDDAGHDGIRLTAHNLTATWDLGAVTLKSITGYRLSDLHYDPDLDGTPVQFTAPLLSGGTMTGGLYNVFGKRDHNQFSEELQAVGTAFGESLNYVGGLYYFRERGSETTVGSLYYDAFAPFVFFNDTSKDFTIHNQSWAIYGQATYAFPFLEERLRLTLGGRYTNDDKRAHKSIHNGLPADMPGKKSWNHFSPAATIDFQAAEDVSVYFRWAEGYNAGVFNVRSTAASFNTPADEETVTSYELGSKSEYFDHRLRLNAALFFSKFKDMQEFLYVAGESVAVNVGNTDIWGAEVEAIAVPVQGVILGITYGYLDYDINKFMKGGVDVASQAVLPLTAKNTASGFAEYAFPPASFGKITVRVDATYRDEVNFSIFDSSKTQADDYALLNARVTLSHLPIDWADASVELWGKNLTDEDYQVFAVDFSQFQTGSFGDPRTFGLDLRLKF